MFQHKSGIFRGETEKMKFVPSRPVKAIAAQDADPKSLTKRMIFYDDDGEKISQWPKESDNGISCMKMHQLAENEDLIGVYGVKGLDDCLSSFGFIVRVKH